jgi:four helix bundle protein
MKENLIVSASYDFALRVMLLARALREKKEYDLASQFWRAGTSIGANIEEAQAAQSRADFQSKMSIAAKEARETRFWLRLARDGSLLPNKTIEPLLKDIDSILRILTSIVKTTSEFKIQNPKSKISSP